MKYGLYCACFHETQNPSGNFCGHVPCRILFKLDKTVENGNILTALIFTMPLPLHANFVNWIAPELIKKRGRCGYDFILCHKVKHDWVDFLEIHNCWTYFGKEFLYRISRKFNKRFSYWHQVTGMWTEMVFCKCISVHLTPECDRKYVLKTVTLWEYKGSL
jgi:hypothetical protein